MVLPVVEAAEAKVEEESAGVRDEVELGGSSPGSMIGGWRVNGLNNGKE